MSFLDNIKQWVRNDLPEAAGGVVEVGTEHILEVHGVTPEAAKDLAMLAGAVTQEAAEAGLAAIQGREGYSRVVLRVASVPDLSMTPSYFVYAMPVRQKEVRSEVVGVAPRLWLSKQSAWVYAENLASGGQGSRFDVAMVLSDEAVVNGGGQGADRMAWADWRHVIGRQGRPACADVPFGPYVVARLDRAGVIAWRPVLVKTGMRAGVLTADDPCSLSAPPAVFESQHQVDRELRRRGLPTSLDVYYMPDSLASELQVSERGAIARAARTPSILPGDPGVAHFSRREAADPDPVELRVDWFVSRDELGGVWAWRKVGEGLASFARIRDTDGRWKTARWPSVSQCLEDLGKLGQLGQEHPTLCVAPEMTATPSMPRRLGMRL